MIVSVMITTRNRSADLRRTCRVLQQLNPPPTEVLITADGCTDETIEVVKAEVPQARLFVNDVGQGSVASRDHMMREAHGDLVLALDDDSYPEQTDWLARVIPLFESSPRLAVLHFPQRTDEHSDTLTQTDFEPEHPTGSFANSGAVLRRSVYLQLPGFEPRFFHMYEEPDYALQCVAEGFEVRFSPAVSIRHHYSGHARSELRNHHRHARNEQWSIWLRCPWPWWPLMSIRRAVGQFVYAIKRGPSWVVREPLWWWRALRGIRPIWRQRRPVAWRAYRRWLHLLRQPEPVASMAPTTNNQ